MPFRHAPAIAAAVLGCASHLIAFAQAEAPSSLDAGLEQQVRQLALDGAQRADTLAPGHARRVEVTIGQLDPRLHLAPCQHVDTYVPEGMRLWGKSRIGLRCTLGTVKWNVYLPITIKVFGTALVATNNLPSGAILSAADLGTAEVDLAEDNSPAVIRAELAVGHALTRPLTPGQSVRASHLKARQWFTAGDTVTVVAVGDGFSVSSEGQALTNGVEGQSARIRTEGGRVVTGLAVGDRRVEMPL